MISIFLACAALALAGCTPRPRPPSAESRWLGQHAARLRATDPSDTDLDDLAPLGTAIGSARIVLLGEQTHGEGSTFLAKTRVIEYLHQRLGFDVLAMESGLYACERAGDDILAGKPARQMFEASVFDVWTNCREFAPLIEYIEAGRGGPHPLELTGVDLQLTGSISRERLARDLRAALRDTAESKTLLAVLEPMLTSMTRFGKIPKPDRQSFYAAAERAVSSLEVRTDGEGRFLRQVLESTVQNARFWWNADLEKPDPAVMNIRDAQMADNLLWLARQRYPGRKIIVWAATSHASRNRQSIRQPIEDAGMVPMGHHLWRAIGPDACMLAFTSARGRFGSWRGGVTDLAMPRAGSLEDACDRTGAPLLFLDLRGSVRRGDWLDGSVLARLMGHARMVARWPDIVDGVFFTRTATPGTALE